MTPTDERPDRSPDQVEAAARRPRPARGRRTWTLALVAVAVVAVLVPVAWLLSRPAPDAGLPLAEALADPTPEAVAPSSPGASSPDAPEPSPEPSAARTPPSPYGSVAVRDASLDALAREEAPAPTRLRVDDLGIDAAVDAVGVEDDGSMVVPAEIARVGWYRYGAAPGSEQGNAVLAGHVDAAGEGPGALFDLRGVEVGTRVTVTDTSGAEHAYEVVGRETVTKDVLPVEEIFARDGAHRLVVITCGGEFLPELRSYEDNVVVTAVPVGSA